MAGQHIGAGGAGERARSAGDHRTAGPLAAADHLDGSGAPSRAARQAAQAAYPFALRPGRARSWLPGRPASGPASGTVAAGPAG